MFSDLKPRGAVLALIGIAVASLTGLLLVPPRAASQHVYSSPSSIEELRRG